MGCLVGAGGFYDVGAVDGVAVYAAFFEVFVPDLFAVDPAVDEGAELQAFFVPAATEAA